jgi:hypothetical protein
LFRLHKNASFDELIPIRVDEPIPIGVDELIPIDVSDLFSRPRDLLTPKCVYKETVTDFRYPRACIFIQLKIGYRPYLYQLFSKRDF